MAPNIPAWLWRIACFCTAIGWFSMLQAQERTAHYHEQNGLLSDFTYSGMFDRNNYLWICTDRGLSRFNGTTFTHFTIKEGLPDNDIVAVQEDEAGVIWATPFYREAAFLEPGKILFTNVDRIIDPDTVRRDKSYRVFLLQDTTVALVAADGTRIRLLRNKRWIRSYCLPPGIVGDATTLFRNTAGALVILNSRDIVCLSDSGRLTKLPGSYPFAYWQREKHWLWLYGKDNSLACIDTRQGEAGVVVRKIGLADTFLRFGFWGDRMLLGTSGRKVTILDIHSRTTATEGKQVQLSAATASKDGKIKVLFSRDEGIYVTTNTDTGLYHELTAAPYFLLRDSDQVQVLGAGSRWLFPEQLKGMQLPGYDQELTPEFAERIAGRTWVYGQQTQVWEKGSLWKRFDTLGNIKDVYRLNDSIRYLASSFGIAVVNVRRETRRWISIGRTTSVSNGPSGTVFAGTQHGLLQLLPGGKVTDWREYGFPDIRVTDLEYVQGVLWVATAGKGLFAIRGKKLFAVADESSGLVSDIIEAMTVDGLQHVVLGYARGGQRISYRMQGDSIKITELLTLHTAPGEGIKYLLYAMGAIYGIGSRGLLILPEILQYPVRDFQLQVDRIIIDGVPRELKDQYILATGTHDFSTAVSTVNYEQFPVRYRYRIDEGAWSYTFEPAISYHNLGPGDYRIEMQVLNNYGKPSGTQLFRVRVLFPFYLRAGFLLVSTVLLLTLFVVSIRLWYRYRYRKANNLLLQETKLRELELAALKAQINPHFVFNCLNSIKALIYQQQLEEADTYMDHFARLFRNTLEGAALPYHSLSQEIDYIRSYLSLEQVNVNNRFSFSIEVQTASEAGRLMLPPMLLQPYVENAVKHGVSRLKVRKGEISIQFQQEGAALICTIADNGTGRGVAQLVADKTGKGLSITERRASLYQIKTEIGDNAPYGTVVRLILSLNHQHQTQ